MVRATAGSLDLSALKELLEAAVEEALDEADGVERKMLAEIMTMIPLTL